MSGSYYLPDITGKRPEYYVPADITTYFKQGQVVRFNQPVFLSSLVLMWNNTTTTLQYGTDYVVSSLDDTAMGLIKNSVPTFGMTLIREIKITSATPITNNMQIVMSYQTLYPSTGVLPYDLDTNAINLTPDLISELYRRVLSLGQSRSAVANTSINLVTPQILDYDPNKTNPNNLIKNESYAINTFQGQNIIRPVNAPFFKDSVVVTIGGQTLVKDVDYVCRGFSPTRTQISTNTSGVYNLILVNKPYAGSDVGVTYWSVGGVVKPSDLTEVQTGYQDLLAYLDGNSYLTNDQLADSPVVLDMLARLGNVEKNMRALLSGSPQYGTTTSGTTVVRNLIAPDTNLHWWNVASLYTVLGSPTVVTADALRLRVEMPNRHFQADLTISADILSSSNKPLLLTAGSVLYDQGYDPRSLQLPSSSPAPIMFRLIWNQTTDNASGIILQFGSALRTLAEPLSITDLSSVDSTWQLTTAASGSISPDDNGPITMPNSSRQWTASSAQSLQATATVPLDGGYLIGGGAISLANIYNQPNNQMTFASSNWNYLDLVNMKKIIISYTTNTGTNVPYRVEGLLTKSVDGNSANAVIVHPFNGASANGILTINLNRSGNITLGYNLPNGDVQSTNINYITVTP